MSDAIAALWIKRRMNRQLGPVNTYAITAAAVASRQCNEEGAAKRSDRVSDNRP